MKIKLSILIFLAIGSYSVSAQSLQQDKNAAADSIATDESVAIAKKKITGSFEMNYLRHYIWRGISFGNDNVAQPELLLNYGKFTLGLAQNFNYKPKEVPKEFYSRNTFFDEQDFAITYADEWGKFSTEFSALAYVYFFQPSSPSTAELYNYTSYNLHKGLSLFTENNIDIAAYAGAIYSNNGISYEVNAKNKWTSTTTAYIGIGNNKFNNSYFAGAKGGVNLIGFNTELTKEIGNYFIILAAEKNIYTNRQIKQLTALKGTSNFKIGVGFNF